MVDFKLIEKPDKGKRIRKENEEIKVPSRPIIPFIEGDGIGPDIRKASKIVLEAAIEQAYGEEKQIVWLKLPAGKKAEELTGTRLPEDTVKAIEHYLVAIKGPLTTPVGGGVRSLNVALRKKLDLYSCVRPVKWIEGVPAPMKNPEELNIVIFRENTEDVYAGIEWEKNNENIKKIYEILKNSGNMEKVRFPETSSIGIKPISEQGTKRLVSSAIEYADNKNLNSVTLVHKGNIMKYTEGYFKKWGYEVAKEKYRNKIITENELYDLVVEEDGVTTTKKEGAYKDLRDGKPPGNPGKRIIMKDKIADAMFQQLLLRPDEYDVIATPNLNGDYISDAAAAQVGGLGIAPGANINYKTGTAVFEPTHGTAPKYRGKDKVNPSSLILSGKMMLEYLGWKKAAELIENNLVKTIKQKKVTYDLERQLKGAKKLKCSEFAKEIVKNIKTNIKSKNK